MPSTSAELKTVAQELYKKNVDLVNANRQLALLQKLYEIMMHTFDQDSICQEFLDVICKDLGFVAGLVALENPLNSHLELVALSPEKTMTKVLNLIGSPMQALQVKLHDNRNVLVRTYKSKRRHIVHGLKDILIPVVPHKLEQPIMDLTQARASIIYPIQFGERTYGVFSVSLNRDIKDLTEEEQNMLKRIVVVFGIALDRVYLYQKIRQANNKLKELDKRKDEFLSVAAHELRAPLTAVKGYLSMVVEGDAGVVPKRIQEFLEGAYEGAEREIRLVNNMLNMSRIEEGRLVYQMGDVRLSKVLTTVFDEFKLDAEGKKLKFKLDIGKSIKDKIFVDPDRIHEVVANFISNAIKYTDKGSVTVRAYNPNADAIRVEVQDTGYGMTQEEQEKLFQKFYRAESSAGKQLGTGLGLYITRLLVKKFDGDLGLESARGKGSLFWFELPLSKKSKQKKRK